METFTPNEKALLIHTPTRGFDPKEYKIPVTIREVRERSCMVDTQYQKGIWVLNKDLRKIQS